MFLTSTLRKSVASIALTSFLALSAGCQKEGLLESQFAPQTAAENSLNGQLIDGQYIVVFKNNSTGAFTGSNEQGLTASRTDAAKMRQHVFEAAGVERTDVSQIYEGIVNGFAARLSKAQLAALRTNTDIAYIEQDRYIALGGISTTLFAKGGSKGDKNLNGNGKGKNEPLPSEPAPTEPAPADPAPADPAPADPAPADPAPTPTEPAPMPTEPAPAPTAPTPAPGYTTVTPMTGEVLSWTVERVGFGDGTGKTIWIIDSGIDTDHPDLNVDLNRCASFIYNMPSVEDGFGHGTNVAGIIAAKNNGSGMLGVASNATIVALRVFDDAGSGSISRAISAVNHASNYAKPGDVVNMSLGGGISNTLDNAVITAAGKGILFAIAAGNSALDCKDTSPARVDAAGVYTVSGMDVNNMLVSSSNFGPAVDFSAPGANVTVTTIGGGTAGGYGGTSMAAPHVAGILLLRGTVFTQGYISGDKDGIPDPIASVQ
ncbi:S8 family serine peptidase [Pontibacter sp. E15-1]|uniref:S8 family serine peptidase n=1 Tax=Pontibacter sp. E15-1 TaxID=2919918 RepID=UPI001F4F5168|nr:S8 family serine peptidase [Pontibacter sp. E15-1]MCJ8166645.1 S8 family serine peptidase [Pontibacter sp. E15-1]